MGEGVLKQFADRILIVDRNVGERWGDFGALDPLPNVDSLIAATALVHGLTVVTRNVKHIAPTGAQCFDPFARPGEAVAR